MLCFMYVDLMYIYQMRSINFLLIGYYTPNIYMFEYKIIVFTKQMHFTSDST